MKINPMDFQVSKQKFVIRASGTKYYCSFFCTAGYSRMSRKRLKSASQAIDYGSQVLARLKRLYQAESSAQPSLV